MITKKGQSTKSRTSHAKHRKGRGKKAGLCGLNDLKANVGLSRSERTWIKRISEALSFDLLHPRYRKHVSPEVHYVTGHCYVATEAAYYLFAMQSGFKPNVHRFSADLTHWWLFHPERGVVLDVTAPQVVPRFRYPANPQSFQRHGTPSKSALQLMVRVLLMSPNISRDLLEKILHKISADKP